MDNNKFQLWSPPLLDLSLDSFSNEIFQEFDKKTKYTTNENEVESVQEKTTIEESRPVTATESEILLFHTDNTTYIASTSPLSSSVTLPQSERAATEEDATSTANLFRRSSTFLKTKSLDIAPSIRNSTISNASSQLQQDDISTMISRQYPPKPLQYSPVVDPPSEDNQTASSVQTPSIISPPSRSSVEAPQESIKNTRSVTPTTTPKPTSKKRFFFSLRFC